MATKKRIVSRVKSGLRGVPMDNFKSMKAYFHMDLEKKQIGDIVKGYVKANYSKRDVEMILANPEYQFTMFSHFGAIAYWLSLKLEHDADSVKYEEGFKKHILRLKESGKEVLAIRKQQEKAAENVVVFQARDRMLQRLDVTVFEDLYKLEDQWANGEQSSYDMFTAFKVHGLPTGAITHIVPIVQKQYDEYNEVYVKDDKQIVEAYSFLSRKEIKHRMDQYKKMLDDLQRLKAVTKATRLPRAKKPKAVDKQIAKIRYKKEDNEFKIVSVNPAKVVGAQRLYTFNTKTRVIAEFISNSTNGFEISGTSIKNFDEKQSRCTKLRKPEAFLQIVMSKTPKTIDIEWAKLTTKTTEPNGRLNEDIVLLKVQS